MTNDQLVGSMMIVGVIVSVVMSILKAKFGSLTSWKSKLVIVALSFGCAGVYYALKVTGFLETAFVILSTASTIYALFIKS